MLLDKGVHSRGGGTGCPAAQVRRLLPGGFARSRIPDGPWRKGRVDAKTVPVPRCTGVLLASGRARRVSWSIFRGKNREVVDVAESQPPRVPRSLPGRSGPSMTPGGPPLPDPNPRGGDRGARMAEQWRTAELRSAE